jgi:hypothetical protein
VLASANNCTTIRYTDVGYRLVSLLKCSRGVNFWSGYSERIQVYFGTIEGLIAKSGWNKSTQQKEAGTSANASLWVSKFGGREG